MWPFNKSRIAEKISRSELIHILPGAEFISALDRVYTLPTNEEVLKVLGSDTTVYQSEINDCEDFAYRAKGLASGNNWPFAVVFVGGSHCLCGFVNDKKEWVWLEPQGRRIMKTSFDRINSIFI